MARSKFFTGASSRSAALALRDKDLAALKLASGYELSDEAVRAVRLLYTMFSMLVTSYLLDAAIPNKADRLRKLRMTIPEVLEFLPSEEFKTPESTEGQHEGLALLSLNLRDNLLEAQKTAEQLEACLEKSKTSEAEMWNNWVNANSQVLSYFGYDVAVSHHASMRKHDRESAFFYFVQSIERSLRNAILGAAPDEEVKSFCEELLPRDRSPDGLAKAISRARQGRNPTLPLREAIAEWRDRMPVFNEVFNVAISRDLSGD